METPTIAGRITLHNYLVTALVTKDGRTTELTFPSLDAATKVRDELDGLIDWMERTG